ncbi:MAG: M1 family metallopeptidase, partial [Flavisolibacter sp.]
MKKLFAFLFLVGCSLTSYSQYWQQQVDFIIDVTLNDREKSLAGFEKIRYQNHSPDTLHYIWFHLWPNAYKNDRTAFSDQMLENGNTGFYFSRKEERGYINRLDFKVDGATARTEDHPEHIDIIKLVLPQPLPPGGVTSITTPFHVKLPFNFSRGGYDEESFQVTQWFPKPAVYDEKGWHPMPYLDQGEFYSEFGNYDVRITVPANYVVAATGELQNQEEKEWLKRRKDFDWKPVVIRTSTSRSKNAPIKKTVQAFPPSATETKTLRYLQANVHDFAWFADKRYKVNYDTCRLSSGRVVDLFTYYEKPGFKLWENGFDYLKDALRFYSEEVGEYPYNVASVVHGPESFGGGMEYPTITILSPVETTKGLDRLIAHEIGHNWFQGVLASNERKHPWMDEGLNSFYEYKYLEQRYGREGKVEELWHLTNVQRKRSQPIATTSENFTSANYALVPYHRTATWLQSIEQALGKEEFKYLMQDYYSRWKFRHPAPDDFLSLLKVKLDATQLYLLDEYNRVENVKSSGFQIVSPFKKGSFKNYLNYPRRNILLLSPAFGVNSYDKLMIGGLVSNYKLPPTAFNFLFVPLYSTGAKSLAGLAKLNYSILSNGKIRKTDFFINASHFSMDQFRDTADRKLTMRFIKLVPGIRMTLGNKTPRQTISKYVQWKTYLFEEQSLRITRDTTITGTDTILFLRYALPKSRRYLNQ